MARIAIVGTGFGGYTCAKLLERWLRPGEAEIVLITPKDYTLYLPLLPQVASGVLQPRSIVTPLHTRLRRSKLLPGVAHQVDLDARAVDVLRIDGEPVRVPYDVLVLAPRQHDADVRHPGPAGVRARHEDAGRGGLPARPLDRPARTGRLLQ
ncbi:FAD-dependent oxidoreductase [Nonomuraea ferruginea]